MDAATGDKNKVQQADQNEGSSPTTLKDTFGDMSEFKKSNKGAEVNLKAATREMPDPAMLDRIRESGVNEEMRDYKPKFGTTLVRTREQARQVLSILEQFKDRIHAWDTETVGIDPKVESPVGHGSILCAQCFIGPDVDFGNGPRLFIDNYADASDLILVFKEYFENPEYLKCWHNYSFDRHILGNHGINCRGFGGDTMHMARLADPSRMRYSLKSLTQEMEPQIVASKESIIQWMKDSLQRQVEE